MEEVWTFEEYLLLGWYEWYLLVQGSSTQTVLSCTKSTTALHKLGWVHYVRRTASEAWNAANANHAKGRWHPGERSYGGWFSEHVPEGYQAWDQFRNGHNYNVL